MLGEPDVGPVDLGALLTAGGEPIERTLRAHIRALALHVRSVAGMHETLATGVWEEWLTPDEALVSPVAEQLARSGTIAEMLSRSVFVRDCSVRRAELEDVSWFRQLVQEPRRYVGSAAVIHTFDRWLHPARDQEWALDPDNLRWHPRVEFHEE